MVGAGALILLAGAGMLIFLVRRKKTSESRISSSTRERVETVLREGYSQLRMGNLAGARESYKEMSKLYSQLEEKNPALYSEIMKFYDSLKDAS